jgi:activator of HSP90 ATPase
MTIRQEITINSSPAKVFEVLTSSARFSDLSGGAPAEIDNRAGGKISMFGGNIVGVNVELKQDQRVVQAWRSSNWDEGHYSIARFDLESDGEGTRISFVHSGYPDGEGDHLSQGWHTMYWEPMKSLLG